MENTMRELNFKEIENVSGGWDVMDNGGNWSNTWAQTGIWASAGEQ